MVRFQKLDIFLNSQHTFLPLGKLLRSDIAIQFLYSLDDLLKLKRQSVRRSLIQRLLQPVKQYNIRKRLDTMFNHKLDTSAY